MGQDFQYQTVCVMGLGYVGLPLALEFSLKCRVIGFDVDRDKLQHLRQEGHTDAIEFTDDPARIEAADFIIIAVPTPVNKHKEPDLSFVTSATETAASHLKPGCVVILESTVYPGVTEELVIPTLEQSGKRCGVDFLVGYSPERINPGDDEHTLDKITKVVAAVDDEALEKVAALYLQIVPTVFKARSIKTAEAAKIIENIQRDLNIALLNEFAMIFEKLGIDTQDVLATAGTKWNFHKFYPGMVGGHCIPVDPYYLVSKAKEIGYHPQVILAGRAVNDYIPNHVAQTTIKLLNRAGKDLQKCRVLVLGLTYKKDVPDTRESPSLEIVRALHEYDVEVVGYDPLLNGIEAEFGIGAYDFSKKNGPVSCVILAVPHSAFAGIGLETVISIMDQPPVLIDVPGMFDRGAAEKLGAHYWNL